MHHTTHHASTPDALKEKILYWAERIRTSNIPWMSGIFPAEMAAFMGLCEHENVGCIIDSGRGPHAYSTRLLGMYAQKNNIPVISMDFQSIDTHPMRDTLKALPVQCLAGDTFKLMPRALRGKKRVALLLDGPKFEKANLISSMASILYDVRVVAHHNCFLQDPPGKEFAAIFPTAFHHEHLELGPAWAEFRQWEKEWASGGEVEDTKMHSIGRSFAQSSLVMATTSKRPFSGSLYVSWLLRSLLP